MTTSGLKLSLPDVLSEEALTEATDQLPGIAHVADLETFELLWTNSAASARRKEQNGEPGKCYSTIYGRSSPCPFCSNLTGDDRSGGSVIQHPGLKTTCLSWVDQREWIDGRKARIELSIPLRDLDSVESANSDSESQFSLLFENMLEGFAYHRILTDDDGTPSDYVFLKVNRAFEKMTGLRREQILGHRVSEVLPQVRDADFDWIGTYGTVALTGEPACFEQYFAPHDRWYSVVAYSPKPKHFVTTFADTTSERRLSDELRRADRVLAVGHLADGIAHEFKNNLSPILSCADLLRAKLTHAPELLELVDTIVKAGEQSSTLADQIQALAKPSEQAGGTVDLRDVTDRVVGVLRRTLNRTIMVGVEIMTGGRLLPDAAHSVEGALLNAGVALSKAMPDGGALMISVQEVELPRARGEWSVQALPEGAYIRATVTHTGDPLPGNEMAALLNANSAGESALHLSCLDLETMAGALSYTTGESAGTALGIFVPLKVGAPEQVKEDPEPVASSQARVLFVDDEQGLRDLIADILRMMGHQVSAFGSARESVAFFEQSWREIDVALLDMSMPEMSGLEVMRELRRCNPNVPVIMTTGQAFDDDLQAALDEGAAELLKKPYAMGELSAAIRDAVVSSTSPGAEQGSAK